MSKGTSKRIAISKKTRFEVFKRDSFTCQYCGASAPDVVLECDHISPVSGGGGNDILNLITSCQACNSGKGARELSDRSAIAKQKAQLDELNERRLKAFEYTPRIAANRKREADKPYMRDLFYIRGILRNRLHYVDERICLILLERAAVAGATIESLRSFAKSVRNWTNFKDEMESFLKEHEVDK